MRLYLSKNSLLNTNYDTEDGQTIYKVETPHRLHRTSTISRVVPNKSENEESGIWDQRDTFAPFASIEWKIFKHSKIQLGTKIIDTKTFFENKTFLERCVLPSATCLTH